MRIAIVMPRGSAMHRDQPNSMETVARTLFGHSRFQTETTFVCDAGDDHPVEVPILTVPAGLEKARHARAAHGAGAIVAHGHASLFAEGPDGDSCVAAETSAT